MSLPRIVSAEMLDHLPETDPAAQRSRRDLQLVHRVMGTRSLILGALGRMLKSPTSEAVRILELGAGDGTLMLGVAQRLRPAWPDVELTLLDRQAVVEETTVDRYARLGWRVSVKLMEVQQWINDCVHLQHTDANARWDLIIVNLFLHHFQGKALADLLSAIAASCNWFLAHEPRRSRLALTGSQLIGVLGVNAVTREDAVLSVRAGFRDAEITRLWKASGAPWHVSEYPAGLFSHCFAAHRA